MKKFFLILISIFLVALTSCQKKPVKNVKKIDPNVQKLARVLSSLSPECKKAIPNGSPKEFLQDLNLVLKADKDDLLILCDKNHFLTEDFEPEDLVELNANEFYNVSREGLLLRSPAEKALRKMGAAANKDGITLLASSTYRSYARQKEVYENLVKTDGQIEADRESAKPGTSQHQLGSVVDFGSIDSSYEKTKPGKWLLQNAHKFGWSLSFPEGYEKITGYRYECWHFRYIGETACRFQKKWFSDVQQFMLEFLYLWNDSKSQFDY